MEKLVCVADFEQAAQPRLDKNAREFYRIGADDEVTLTENQRAFRRWVIRPRVLRDVSRLSLATTVLGKPVAFAIGVAPTAMQKLCHEEGEVANARAAAALGTIFILSTLSTCSLEEVAHAAPHGRRWFQLYVFDKDGATKLVRRAEQAGYEALVVTVDAPNLGNRRAGLRNKFQLPGHLSLANFGTKSEVDPLFTKKDATFTWSTVDWLKRNTKLPVILKGILTAEDARLAVEHGVAAVFVSNHGGRQLDTVGATIDVLGEIVEAVRGRCEVYVDSGVRTGSDVFKALALGANMTFAGRPLLWGLTMGGEVGARRVLEILRDEMQMTMHLAGVASVGEINHRHVERLSSL